MLYVRRRFPTERAVSNIAPISACCNDDPYRSGNYARFIALYDGAPRMSPYIMDRVLGQVRA